MCVVIENIKKEETRGDKSDEGRCRWHGLRRGREQTIMGCGRRSNSVLRDGLRISTEMGEESRPRRTGSG